MSRSIFSVLMLALSICVAGCGGEEPFRKQTYPVVGKVTVDGKPPGSAIQIECHPVGGMDAQHPTVSQTESDPDGNFKISTYAAGDGVPAGDYTLTFTWLEFNIMSRSYGGPDKLNGKYSDPKTSEIKITVKEGSETNLNTIELKTK
ncbi:MAG: carboxypeptidase regulatory-like domain-containing protein [Planctomycetaceae bacterium]|nr:carboxypeptidase regulatory-like domain-containing protein [Planctomycetaceae bacterium]